MKCPRSRPGPGRLGWLRRSCCRWGFHQHERRRQKLGVCSAINTSPSCRMPHTRMSLPLALSFSWNRTPSPTTRPDPLDQVARLIIEDDGHVTVEVREAARRATSDLEHSLSHPRRHRLRCGERHACNLPTVRVDQKPEVVRCSLRRDRRASPVPLNPVGVRLRCLPITVRGGRVLRGGVH
jgi:hypothetical protein